MAQINKPSSYMNTVLYTGNGTVESDTQAITGVGFQPDFVWIKMRSGTDGNILEDSVRGVGRYLISNTTGAEGGGGTGLLDSFDSDGFTVNCDEGGNVFNTSTNGNGSTYASWSWLGGGTASSNTDGSITSSVSANTTSGFSIVSYTGNATAGATVGHGLGSTPSMIIIKVRSANNNWGVYHKSMGATKAMYLDGNSAETTDGWLNNTAPDSSVFTLSGGNYGNTSGNTHIAYCFAEKKGYSKFGSYTGNGSTDGTFVYTGFKPAFILIKKTSNLGAWPITDNKRVNAYNPTDTEWPAANLSDAETTGYPRDLLSNGFKMRVNATNFNASGDTYIYMAFAESPLVGTNNIPATAR